MSLPRLTTYRFADTTAFSASGAAFSGESNVYFNRTGEAKKKLLAEDILWLLEAIQERHYWALGNFKRFYPPTTAKGAVAPLVSEFEKMNWVDIHKIRSELADIFIDINRFENQRDMREHAISPSVDTVFPLDRVVKFDSYAAMMDALRSCMMPRIGRTYTGNDLKVDDIDFYFEQIRRAKRIVTSLPSRSIQVNTTTGSASWYENKWHYVTQSGTMLLFDSGNLMRVEKLNLSKTEASGSVLSFDGAQGGLPYTGESHSSTNWIIWLHGMAKGVDANNRLVHSYADDEYEHSIMRFKVPGVSTSINGIIDKFASFYGFFDGTTVTGAIENYARKVTVADPALGFAYFNLDYETIGQEIGSEFFKGYI